MKPCSSRRKSSHISHSNAHILSLFQGQPRTSGRQRTLEGHVVASREGKTNFNSGMAKGAVSNPRQMSCQFIGRPKMSLLRRGATMRGDRGARRAHSRKCCVAVVRMVSFEPLRRISDKCWSTPPSCFPGYPLELWCAQQMWSMWSPCDAILAERIRPRWVPSWSTSCRTPTCPSSGGATRRPRRPRGRRRASSQQRTCRRAALNASARALDALAQLVRTRRARARTTFARSTWARLAACGVDVDSAQVSLGRLGHSASSFFF